jgi:hypothetical protein
MTKLTSADIVKEIITHCQEMVMNRFGYHEPNQDEEEKKWSEKCYADSQNPKLWKRVAKSSVKSFVEKNEPLTFDQVFGVNSYWEDITWFTDDFSKITDDCICRHFVNTTLQDGCDPVVVTDPKDEKILAMFWHAD